MAAGTSFFNGTCIYLEHYIGNAKADERRHAIRDEEIAVCIIRITLVLVDLLIFSILLLCISYGKSLQIVFGFMKADILYYDIHQFYPAYNPASSLASSLGRSNAHLKNYTYAIK